MEPLLAARETILSALCPKPKLLRFEEGCWRPGRVTVHMPSVLRQRGAFAGWINRRFPEGQIQWTHPRGRLLSVRIADEGLRPLRPRPVDLRIFGGRNAPPPDDRKRQAYDVRIDPAGCTITSESPEGLSAGLAMAKEIITLAPDGKTVPCLAIADWPALDIRGLHIDLKHFMHTTRYLEHLLDLMGTRRFNTVVLEYEDKFPFASRPFLRHPLALTVRELDTLLRTAADCGITVIPLQQTLGHLEYALKHPQLVHLREIPDSPYQLCPAKPESFEFVRSVLDEMFRMHPDSPLVHIGADEAMFLGRCPACKRIADRHGKEEVYIRHIEKVCRYVIDHGKTPILWDDVVRRDYRLIKRLADAAMFHYWAYGSQSDIVHPADVPENIRKAAGIGKTGIISASASKLPAYDMYRALGKSVVGGPCWNDGQIVWDSTGSINNAFNHARCARFSAARGIISTSWQCFMNPFDVSLPGVFVTAEAAWNAGTYDGADTVYRYCRNHFGANVPGAAEAVVRMGAAHVRGLTIQPHTFDLIDLRGWDYFARLGTAAPDEDPYEIAALKIGRLKAGAGVTQTETALASLRMEAVDAVRNLTAGRSMVRRNRDTYEMLLWSARMLKCKTEFWLLVICAIRGVSGPVWKQALRQLRELEKMERATGPVLRRTIRTDEITKEVRRIFSGERRILGELARGPVRSCPLFTPARR